MSALAPLSGRNVLITGINGFIGPHVAAAAQKAGALLTGVDLPHASDRPQRVRASLGVKEFPVIESESLDGPAFAFILNDTAPALVVHLAGITSKESAPHAWSLCAGGNAMLTASLLEGLLSIAEDRRPALVVPGSQMEYGFAQEPWTEETRPLPANIYGSTKLAASEFIQTAARRGDIRACVTRLPIVFGPGQPPTMMIPEIINKGLRGIDVPTTPGRQRRKFLYAGDAAHTLLALGCRLLQGAETPTVVNSPASEPVAIVDLARKLMTALGDPVELQVGALPQRKDERMEAFPDTSLAESLGLSLEWPLEEALQETVAWYRANQWFVEQ